MSGDDFTAGGAGVDVKGRYAFSNYIAIDYGIGIFGLSGTFENDSSDSDLSFVDVPMSVNLEIQPYKNDFFSIILFAGPTLEVISMTMEMNSDDYDADYEATETYNGFQAADVVREESSQEDEDSNVETFIFRIGWVW